MPTRGKQLSTLKKKLFRNKFTEYKNNSNKTWKAVKTLVPNNRYHTSDCTEPTQSTEHFNYFSKIGKLTYEQTTTFIIKTNHIAGKGHN